MAAQGLSNLEAHRPEAIQIPQNWTTTPSSGQGQPVVSTASKASKASIKSKYFPESETADGTASLTLRRRRNSLGSIPNTALGDRFPRSNAFVRSTVFESLVGLVILLNCATIGIEVQAMVEEVAEEVLKAAEICEHIFTAFFLLEFIARLMFIGWRTYVPCVQSPVDTWEQLQNFSDALLVWGTGVGMSWIIPLSGVSMDSQLRIFAVLRAFRLLRLVRVVRKLPAFNEVYLLIRGLSDSTKTLFWTIMVVFFMTYIFAIFGVVLISVPVDQSLNSARGSASAEELATLEMLKEHTSGVTAWMYTLIQVLTLDSWNSVSRPLETYAGGSWIFFYAYISFAVIVFMNLVTAVIVENALSNSKQDEETLLAQKEMESKKLMKTFRALFEMMDEDGDGTLTLDEFTCAFQTNEVATKLLLLGFKEDDCQVIFDLLDEGDGSLTIDEFFEGLQEMKGPAQAKQAFIVRKRVDQIWNLLCQFTMEVEEDIHHLLSGRRPRRRGSLMSRAREGNHSPNAVIKSPKGVTSTPSGLSVFSPRRSPTTNQRWGHMPSEKKLSEVSSAGGEMDQTISMRSFLGSATESDDAAARSSAKASPETSQVDVAMLQKLLDRMETLSSDVKGEMRAMSARIERVEATSALVVQKMEELTSPDSAQPLEPKLRERRTSASQCCSDMVLSRV